MQTSADKNRWIAENLDRINLTVPRGQKDVVRLHAEKHGESVNGFIQRAVRETIQRDNESDAVTTT